MALKIAVIQRFLPSLSRGGVGYFAHGLCNALAARGHTMTVFSHDPAPRGARYQVVTLPQPSSHLGRRLAPLQFPFQLSRLRFSDFDILHAQGDDYLIPRRLNPPVVRTMHGSALAEALHNGLRLGSPRRCLMHLFFYLCEIISDLRADAVVAVSENTRCYYPRIHSVISGGIDPIPHTSGPGEKTSHPTILFVGELFTRKRGRFLVDVVRREILPRLPEAELWLVCPERMEGRGIHWWGSVGDEQLVQLYRQAWVFCLPSSYEGFGRPYIEAMAAGTPVVATPNPGASEILAGGQYGLLVSDRRLGEALYSLLRDGDLRKQYSQLGFERAHHYLWSKVAEQYEGVYENILRKRTGRGQPA